VTSDNRQKSVLLTCPRDTHVTERLDYVSADALVFYSFFMTVARVTGRAAPRQWLPVGLPLVAFFAFHMHYMLAVKFDYGCICPFAARHRLPCFLLTRTVA
jgi:Per1-like family